MVASCPGVYAWYSPGRHAPRPAAAADRLLPAAGGPRAHDRGARAVLRLPQDRRAPALHVHRAAADAGGSQFNIPLYSVTVPRGTTVVAINVGGALVPMLLSLYLFLKLRMYVRMLVGITGVAVIVPGPGTLGPGVGPAGPVLVPPPGPAGGGLVLAFRRAAPGARVAGSM